VTPLAIYLVVFFLLLVVLLGIHLIVFAPRGLMDRFCNLPFWLLESILSHDPMVFLAVIDRMFVFQILLYMGGNVSVLSPSMIV
jgi:hypothetical protein